MNTLEILRILDSDKIVKHLFRGVFALNKIPKVKKYPSAFIVNLDDSSQPGSHWVGMYFNKRHHCDYFDSYGRPPYELQNYILSNSKSYTYNNIQVQRFLTITCGPMSLYFIVWRTRGITFKNIVLIVYLKLILKLVYKYKN